MRFAGVAEAHGAQRERGNTHTGSGCQLAVSSQGGWQRDRSAMCHCFELKRRGRLSADRSLLQSTMNLKNKR
jgi:hypothetical protein